MPGNVTLVREMGGNKVNVWTSDRSTSAGSKLTFDGQDNVFAVGSLPVDLWVEGNAVSSEQRDVRLALRHTNAYKTQRDQVAFTVCDVEIVSPANGADYDVTESSYTATEAIPFRARVIPVEVGSTSSTMFRTRATAPGPARRPFLQQTTPRIMRSIVARAEK